MIKDPHFEIVGVVTQPDRQAGRSMKFQPSPVKALVQPLGIPVLTPESINTPEILEGLRTLKAEAVVVVAYGQILKQPFLDMYPNKVVNVHASLLPRWRGAAPIQRALMEGDKETGVCLQIMRKKLDSGPVLGDRKISLHGEMNAIDLYRECERLGAELIKVDLMDYLRGNLTPVEQDEKLVTYAKKIEKAEAEIDWRWDAERIHNLIRGLALGPVAQTHRLEKILKIHRSRVVASIGALKPGQASVVSEKSLIVQCGKGSLDLLEVQPESRAKMPIEGFLRGYPVKPGDWFGDSKVPHSS